MLHMPLPDSSLNGPAEQPWRFDFDTAADTYDSWYETAEGAMYDRLEKKAVSKCLDKNTGPARLLEVGCGTGHWSRFFSDHGFDVTGIDISPAMIKVAQAKNIPNASFQVADAHSLPFTDNSFDITAAVTTLEFVNDAKSVLKEMARCTIKPKGQLIAAVLNSLAPLNRRRQQNDQSLYSKARMFSPGQLKNLLQPYGSTYVRTAGFVCLGKLLFPFSHYIDTLGRRLHLPYGAFIAGRVIL